MLKLFPCAAIDYAEGPSLFKADLEKFVADAQAGFTA